MTLDEAHALAATLLGPAAHVHLFTGRTRAWWGLVRLRGALDCDGNVVEWAEQLGYLTPVTVRELALEASRQFAPFGFELPENSPLRAMVPRGTIAAVPTEGETARPATPGTP